MKKLATIDEGFTPALGFRRSLARFLRPVTILTTPELIRFDVRVALAEAHSSTPIHDAWGCDYAISAPVELSRWENFV